jgi:branched-chain amino acid transport system permease protein
VTFLVLLAVIPASVVFGQPFWINLATRIVIFALAAVSLNFILGYGGMVSFGHAAFFAVGGYTAALLSVNGVESALVTWPAAVLAAAIAGAAIGALSLRTTGLYFILITLGFAQMIFFSLVAIKAIGGNDGLPMAARSVLPGLDLRNATAFYVVTVVLLAVFVGVVLRIGASPFGMVLQAARQNERRVRSVGFPVTRYKLVAFVIAAAGAGLAGALAAEYARFVSPEMASWQRSGDFLVMVILGGVGAAAGPILGSAALIAVESLLSGWTEHWMLPLGLSILAFVLFARRGLAGLWRGGRVV